MDKSGSDVTRLCYVSWDPSIIINEQSIPFSLDPNLFNLGGQEPSSNDEITLPKNPFTKVLAHQKSLYFKTEGRNKKVDREAIQKIYKFLTKKRLSITSSHSNWLRIGFAIANTFTFDIGEGYFLKLCRLDGEKHDEYKSKCLIDYCYRNRRSNGPNMATIIFLSREKGF